MAENKWVTGVITPYNKWSYFTLPGTQMFFFFCLEFLDLILEVSLG